VKRIATFSALAVGTVAAVLGAGSGPARAGAPANQILITPPSHVRSQVVYDITVRGYVRRRATAYLFVDYSGCATTLTAEARRAQHAFYSYPVSGSFAEVSGWKSSSVGTDHACAYLIARAGTQLASARIALPVR
jgi:hypothetical protein